MTKSLDDLESDLSRPVLVQISTRSQSTVDTVLTPGSVTTAQPLVAQYSVRSETRVPRFMSSSIPRIASAEDMRIEAETTVVIGQEERPDTLVIGPGTRHPGKSTIV